MSSLNIDTIKLILENNEYDWLLEDDNIENIIKIFTILSIELKDINSSLWCKVICLWLRGNIIDISSIDLINIANNPKPIFLKYNSCENDYIMYIQDLFYFKVGAVKYNLFKKWINNNINSNCI